MTKKLIALVSMTTLCACAATSVPDLPPQLAMEDMHGSCSDFTWDLTHEWQLWDQEGAAIVASTDPDRLPTLNIDTVATVALSPNAQVRYAATPEKDRGKADRYAGLASFVPMKNGVYRISASSGVWIDAVQSGTVVPSERFQMQTGCDRIFKSLAYRLNAGVPVTIQINGSQTKDVRLLLTHWR